MGFHAELAEESAEGAEEGKGLGICYTAQNSMRLLLLIVVFAAGCCAAPKAEILWDQYGVPHIFATDRESMFYANGWAQAQAQGNLLLHLYGESRGRAAEYWGASHLELDRW